MKWPWNNKKIKTGGQKTPSVKDLWPTLGDDICDACPAPAKVRVFVPHTALIIDMCSHHFRKNHKKFEELGYIWIDGRHEREKFTKTERDIYA